MEEIGLSQQITDPEAIRAIQLDSGDDKTFWFRDDLHNPYPVTAFGMSTVQRGHMWGFALAAEEAQLPPSRGAVVKTYNHRVYLGFVGIDDPNEIGQRAQHFGPFIGRTMENWDEFYGNIIKEAKDLTVPNVTKDLTGLSYGELAGHLMQCQSINLKCWYYHFLTMYVANAVYMGGEHFAKEHGVEEKDYTILLKGFETKGMESDRGQFLLIKSAMAKEAVVDLLMSKETTATILSKVADIEGGDQWWREVQDYISEYGHRSTAAVLDVNYPTWYEDPSPVIENIRTMLPKVQNGWDFEKEREKTAMLREQAVERVGSSLSPEAKEVFKKGLPQWQEAHRYNEDHWFYLEQVNWSGLRYATKEVGSRLAQLGILDTGEDVFHLTYGEVLEALDSLEMAEAPGKYAYSALMRPLVAHRKKQHERAGIEQTPPFLGALPDKVVDPVAIKVFGLTDFVLDRARNELAGVKTELKDTFEGFPGAPGIVEGTARVVTHHDGLASFKAGDILVTPFTSPAWTPVFPKIAAIVTDSGGMLTHAAICAREYGIPAVVGTWVATETVRDGDYIRVNGDEGRVEILTRA